MARSDNQINMGLDGKVTRAAEKVAGLVKLIQQGKRSATEQELIIIFKAAGQEKLLRDLQRQEKALLKVARAEERLARAREKSLAAGRAPRRVSGISLPAGGVGGATAQEQVLVQQARARRLIEDGMRRLERAGKTARSNVRQQRLFERQLLLLPRSEQIALRQDRLTRLAAIDQGRGLVTGPIEPREERGALRKFRRTRNARLAVRQLQTNLLEAGAEGAIPIGTFLNQTPRIISPADAQAEVTRFRGRTGLVDTIKQSVFGGARSRQVEKALGKGREATVGGVRFTRDPTGTAGVPSLLLLKRFEGFLSGRITNLTTLGELAAGLETEMTKRVSKALTGARALGVPDSALRFAQLRRRERDQPLVFPTAPTRALPSPSLLPLLAAGALTGQLGVAGAAQRLESGFAGISARQQAINVETRARRRTAGLVQDPVTGRFMSPFERAISTQFPPGVRRPVRGFVPGVMPLRERRLALPPGRGGQAGFASLGILGALGGAGVLAGALGGVGVAIGGLGGIAALLALLGLGGVAIGGAIRAGRPGQPAAGQPFGQRLQATLFGRQTSVNQAGAVVAGVANQPTLGPGENRRFRGFGTAVRTVGQFAGASTIIFAFTAAIRTAITSAIELEDILAKIQGVFPTRSELARLTIQASIIENARLFGVNLLQAAESAKIFAQQGLNAAEVSRELGATLLAVQGAGLDPQQAREFLTAVRNITEEEVGSFEIIDRIARVESQRAVDAKSLAQALQRAGPLARQFRGEFVGLVDEMDLVIGATTAIVERSRVSGQQAATSLRFILARLGRPQVLRQLEAFGARLGTIASGGKQLRPLLEIFQELSEVFERLKGEGTAESTRFLVSLAGARQVNPAAILLENFEQLISTANLSALAFGDAQERLAIRLDTTKTRLTQLTNEIRVLGFNLFESGTFATTFRVIIGTLTNVMGGLAKGTRFATLKLTALIVGGIVAFKVITGLTGAVLLLSKGLEIAALKAAALQAGLITRSLVTAGVGLTGFFSGLAAIVGPGGVVILTVLAITAALVSLVAIVNKIRNIGKPKVSPLEAKFLTAEDIDLTDNRAVQRFRETAQEFGTTLPSLLEGARKSIVPIFEELDAKLGDRPGSLTDNLKFFRDELGTTREELVNKFLKGVGEEVPGFTDKLAKLTKGMTDVQRQTLETAIAMDLMGQATFLVTSVVGANIQKAVDQATELTDTFTASLVQIGRKGDELARKPLFELTPAAIQAGRTPEAIRKRLEKVFAEEDLGEDVNVLLAKFLTFDEDFIGGIIQGFSDRATGTVGVNIGEFLARFNAEFAKQLAGPDAEKFKADASAKLSEVLADIVGIGKAGPILAEEFDVSNQFVQAAENFQLIIPEALEGLRKLAEAKILSPQQQEAFRQVEQLNARIAKGGTVAAAALSGAFTKIRDPLRDLLVNFFIAEQRITGTVRAARALGFAFSEVEARAKSARDFGTKLFNIEAEFTQRILRNFTAAADSATTAASNLAESVQEILSAQGRPSESIKDLDVTQFAAEKGKVQIDKLKKEAEILAIRLRELFGPEQQNIFEVFNVGAGLGTDVLAQVDKLRTFFGRFINEVTGGLEGLSAAEIADFIAEAGISLKDFLEIVVRVARARDQEVIAINRQKLAIETQTKLETQRLGITREIAKAQLDSALTLATTGLRPFDAILAKLGKIQQARALDLAFAREEARLDIEKINRQKVIGTTEDVRKLDELISKRLDDLKIEEDRINLEATREGILLRISTREQEILNLQELQQTNLDARLAGLKEILSDFEALTGGEAIRKVLGTFGQEFVNRQVDLLFDALFDAQTGLLKGIGATIGLAGETDPIRLAMEQGGIVAGEIIKQKMIEAVTGVPGAGVAAATGGLRGIGGTSPFGGLPRTKAGRLAEANAQADALAKAQRRQSIQQLIQAGATIAGNIGGAALGGGGVNAQAGSAFGTGLGTIAGTAIGGAAIGGPVGALLGGLVGGLFGGLADEPEKPEVKALQVIARNTGESVTLLENTNRLLDPSNLAFNLPTGFRLPSFSPFAFGGGGGIAGTAIPSFSGGRSGGGATFNNQINVTVQGGGSSTEVGRQIAATISQELTAQLSTAGSRFVPRT